MIIKTPGQAVQADNGTISMLPTDHLSITWQGTDGKWHIVTINCNHGLLSVTDQATRDTYIFE